MKKLNVYASANSENHIRKHGSCIVTDHQPDEAQLRPSLLLIAEDGEQLPEVPEWIKCSDRLPEVKSEVLVWEKDGPSDPGTIWIATRLSDTAWELGDGEPPFIVEAARVTHWQPLPKAPNQ